MWTTPPASADAMPRASTATATRNPTLSVVICASRPLIRPYDGRERARGAALPQCPAATPTRYRRHDGRSGTAGHGILAADLDIATGAVVRGPGGRRAVGSDRGRGGARFPPARGERGQHA